jgi:hypothetical protein
MTEDPYHNSIPAAQRIQKRLVLNRSFKRVRDHAKTLESVTYMTFGGEDLYDVMDLLCVFDVSKIELRVVSYEQNEETLKTAKRCRIVRTLDKLDSVSFKFTNSDFPTGIERYHRGASAQRFVYFLDYMGTFGDSERKAVAHLMSGSMLRPGDYVLITSALNPFHVNKPTFMHKHREAFAVFFDKESPSADFKIRNHVDLHLGMAASDLQLQGSWRAGELLRFDLLGKFRYNDTGTPMGVWVYAVSGTSARVVRLKDARFEAFPSAFAYAPIAVPTDLFDDLF